MYENWIKPENNFAIEINGLTKIYESSKKKFKALDNINLNIKCGSFYGLLGPNGAGKSTIINIIGGTVLKNNGLVKIWGLDIDKKRKQSKLAIGIVPQELNIDAFFTPKDLLELQAGLFNVPKNERITKELLELFDLTEKADEYSRKLSGGMRRRLLVAKAMVHKPPIIILDEPTAGVDIELRKKLWLSFRKLNKKGATIILTTHYLEEADALCDEVAIIHKGKIVANNYKNILLDKLDKKSISIVFDKNPSKITLKKLETFGKLTVIKNNCILNYEPSKVSVDKILDLLKESQIKIIDLNTKEVNLEDVFTSLTKD